MSFIIRRQASRRHLRPEQLDQWTAKAAPTNVTAAVLAKPTQSSKLESRKHQWWQPIPDSPVTPPPIAQAGEHPGSAIVVANRVSFRRVHLQAPSPTDIVAPAPAPAGEPFAAFDTTSWLSQRERWPERAQHLQLNALGVFEETPPSFYTGDYPSAFAPERANHIRFDRRFIEALAVPSPSQVSAQPVSAFQSPVVFRRSGGTEIVQLPQFPDLQQVVLPSTPREAVNHVWYWDRYGVD